VPQEKRQRQKAARQARQEQIRQARVRRRRRNQIVVIAVVVALIGLLAYAFSGSGGKKTNVASNGSSTTAPGGKAVAATCPKADGSSPKETKFKSAPSMCIDPAKSYTAHVVTSEGAFDIALDTKKTPKTANNFVFLSRYHYYDSTTVFRIDNSIDILQTGGPTNSPSDPGPGYTIKDEGKGFQYGEGDVVMARTSAPDSGGSQYFLVYGPQAAQLNSQGTYVTFGKVTGDGLAVLKKIGALYVACPQGDPNCLGGKPSHTVTIQSITIKEG
jgi:cyclophilin family peptidyl-prolyl cis-trans isomerase